LFKKGKISGKKLKCNVAAVDFAEWQQDAQKDTCVVREGVFLTVPAITHTVQQLTATCQPLYQMLFIA
jgi:hypothetical protein